MSAMDIQVGGTHYRDMKIQPVEFIQDNLMGFCEGSVIKYVCRWRFKGGLEDLRKARHYIELIRECPDYLKWFVFLRRAFPLSGLLEDHPLGANEFLQANCIENPEAGVIRHIWLWNMTGNMHELEAATKWIQEAIEQANG